MATVYITPIAFPGDEDWDQPTAGDLMLAEQDAAEDDDWDAPMPWMIVSDDPWKNYEEYPF